MVTTMETNLSQAQPQTSDLEVVGRVLRGDVAAFEILMRRYNQRLFRAARAILKDDAEAEDAVQDAYVNAYVHLSTFEGRARFSSWLTRLVINEALGRLRRQRRFEAMNDEGTSEELADEEDPEQRAERRELARMMERAIDELPEAFRTVFMLRAVQGLTLAETSECLAIPEETVKTRLHRARAKLQENVLARTDEALPEVHRFLGERCDRIVAGVMRRIGLSGRS
jgi:RNA polymerase sigma-70 factor (ECF subfamily)